MIALWILRHAKAGAKVGDDHARPLTERGRRQCAQLAERLGEEPPRSLPELVLCSSARRARETAELCLGALGHDIEVRVDDGLYQADVEDVLELLHLLDEDLSRVMVVGHNPTLEELAWRLVDSHDEAGRAALAGGMSTGALAVVDCELPGFASLVPGGGRLRWLYAPDARGAAQTRGQG